MTVCTYIPCDLVSFSSLFPAWSSHYGICQSLAAGLPLSSHTPSIHANSKQQNSSQRLLNIAAF